MSKERALTLYDVVTKLVGETMPVGETHKDEARFENLKALTELVDKLIFDIDAIGQIRHRHQFSISRAGKFASDFLNSLGIEE